MRPTLAVLLVCGCQAERAGEAPAPTAPASAATVQRSAASAPSATPEVAPKASARVPDLDAALAALPEAARRDATVILLGELYRERGAHVDGVWHALEGYRVIRVYRGTVASDHVGVRAGAALRQHPGQVALLALRPSPGSLALLAQDRARFDHANGLGREEILAVVPAP